MQWDFFQELVRYDFPFGVKVEIHQLPTLPTSSLRTSSPTSGGPLVPSGSLQVSPKIYYECHPPGNGS
jgi:hypothetical protein